MDEASVRQLRVLLRQVQEHRLAAHRAFGCVQQSAGMVDLVHHPASALPDLNYVLPRRNTAWVPVAYVEQGLRRLRELNRAPVFQYLDVLFPAEFAGALLKAGLRDEPPLPVMAYTVDGLGGVRPPRPATLLPDGACVRAGRHGRGIRLWRQAGARQIVAYGGLVDLTPGADAQAIDLTATFQRRAVGFARLDTRTDTGWLAALVVAGDAPDEMASALVAAALRSALRRGCRLIFAHPETPEGEMLLQTAGFIAVSWLRRFTLPVSESEMKADDDFLAQSVSAARRPERDR